MADSCDQDNSKDDSNSNVETNEVQDSGDSKSLKRTSAQEEESGTGDDNPNTESEDDTIGMT